jgi:3-deoxy-D-manno-octulosonic acid kinase|tara:strand:+ start:139 stop:867 length:729 start_codon:yes stop_codon:yes gene_type:complete
MKLLSKAWFDINVEKGRLRFSDMLLPEAEKRGEPDPDVFNGLLFDPNNPSLQARAVQKGGRQSAWFVQGIFGSAVLRHYRRGGLVAKISANRYCWQGAQATRSMAEFVMLHEMMMLGLPVPAPLAAGYWRRGMSYRAALVVARIENATPLASQLLPENAIRVASVLKQFHDANIWHADLNAFNILLDTSGTVWLIDFDRGRFRFMSAALRQRNLRRLRRSLVKVAGQQGDAFWQALNSAYYA